MEDKQIVQLYLNRDETAIAHTTQKYGKYCNSIAKNILGSNEDAEECVNDTYLRAWNAIPPNIPDMLSTFLGKITRNLAFNKYRHDKAAKRGGGQISLILDELSECIADTNSVEEKMEYQELVNSINMFLATLSEDKRNIFIRRYWYSDSVKDIAKAYSMKENSVSMLLIRQRAKLHDYLLERGFGI